MAKMEINSISVTGFRNVTNTTIYLDSPMTYLISPNNYGKSNVFKAIDFASMLLQSRKSLGPAIDHSSLNTANLNEDYSFVLDFAVDRSADPEVTKMVRYRYSFSIAWGEDKPTIKSEALEGYDTQRPTIYLRREGTKAFYKQSETGRADSRLMVDDNSLCVWKLEAYDHLFYVDVVKAILSFGVLTVHGLAGSPIPGLIGFSIPHADLDYEYLNNSVAQPIWNIKEGNKQRYTMIKNAMKHLFPDFLDFIPNKNVPTGANKLAVSDKDVTYSLFVSFKSMSKAISISKTSDGFRGILSTLVSLSLQASHETIVCIEEPENYINPGLLKNYIQILNDFLDGAKAIVASHSPFIANYVLPSQIYIGIPNDDHLASFSSFTDQGAKKLVSTSDKAKMPIGEFIFNLLCGDESDVDLLRKYLKNR